MLYLRKLFHFSGPQVSPIQNEGFVPSYQRGFEALLPPSAKNSVKVIRKEAPGIPRLAFLNQKILTSFWNSVEDLT